MVSENQYEHILVLNQTHHQFPTQPKQEYSQSQFSEFATDMELKDVFLFLLPTQIAIPASKQNKTSGNVSIYKAHNILLENRIYLT